MVNKKFKLIVPAPFKKDKFILFQKGICDNSRVNAYINNRRDFVFLYPQSEVDYINYTPRVKKLSLEDYKKKNLIYERRFEKISQLLKNNITSLLEIGASEGSFLRIVKGKFSRMKLFAIEPDQNKMVLLKKIIGLVIYKNIETIIQEGNKFDCICLFHVFEHIINPRSFLAKIRQLMHPHSIIIAEVPSLFDPLLSLYDCEAYKRFYFQIQHPFVYSQTSIRRIMEYYGFKTQEIINYQRYGLENHLNWMINNAPGGNEIFRKIFCDSNESYLASLERCGKTDSVIWVGRLKEK